MPSLARAVLVPALVLSNPAVPAAGEALAQLEGRAPASAAFGISKGRPVPAN